MDDNYVVVETAFFRLEMMLKKNSVYGNIEHNGKVVSMGIYIWNKRDKLLLTSERYMVRTPKTILFSFFGTRFQKGKRSLHLDRDNFSPAESLR